MRMAMTLLFGGCGVQIGGEGEPTPEDGSTDTCGDEVESVVGWSDVVLDGHSGDEILALFSSPRVYEPRWTDGRTESITLTGTPIGDTVTVHDYPDGVAACYRRIEADFAIRLTSADGTFDEAFETRIRWSSPWTYEDLSLQIPVTAIQGTLDWAAVQPAATEFIGYFRVTNDGLDLGFVELRAPNPNVDETGSETVNERVCEWGDLGPDGGSDTGI